MFWVSETQVKCVGKRIYEAGFYQLSTTLFVSVPTKPQTTKIKLSLASRDFH